MQSRRFFSLVVGVLVGVQLFGQYKKQFHVDDTHEVEKIELTLRFNSGQCLVKPTQQSGLLNIYSRHDSDHFDHNFSKSLSGNIAKLNLSLEETQTEGLGKSISNSLFGENDEGSQKYWKVFLSENKPYDLNLNFGVGSAKIDLSNLSVEKLKIQTGGTDINVGYFTDSYNAVEMDTFYVKVDLGSVVVKQLNYARSEHVIADVGFGNLYLDFSDQPQNNTKIKGRVGAGSLYIMLPSEEIPMKVTIKNSWLCSVKLPTGFKKTGDYTYENEEYKNRKDNSLEFDLDVAMGSLVFKQK